MFVTIESAIVHVFNQADGYPIFSDIPIALDAEFETYLCFLKSYNYTPTKQ